jgi:hypothetical protein
MKLPAAAHGVEEGDVDSERSRAAGRRLSRPKFVERVPEGRGSSRAGNNSPPRDRHTAPRRKRRWQPVGVLANVTCARARCRVHRDVLAVPSPNARARPHGSGAEDRVRRPGSVKHGPGVEARVPLHLVLLRGRAALEDRGRGADGTDRSAQKRGRCGSPHESSSRLRGRSIRSSLRAADRVGKIREGLYYRASSRPRAAPEREHGGTRSGLLSRPGKPGLETPALGMPLSTPLSGPAREGPAPRAPSPTAGSPFRRESRPPTFRPTGRLFGVRQIGNRLRRRPGAGGEGLEKSKHLLCLARPRVRHQSPPRGGSLGRGGESRRSAVGPPNRLFGKAVGWGLLSANPRGGGRMANRRVGPPLAIYPRRGGRPGGPLPNADKPGGPPRRGPGNDRERIGGGYGGNPTPLPAGPWAPRRIRLPRSSSQHAAKTLGNEE